MTHYQVKQHNTKICNTNNPEQEIEHFCNLFFLSFSFCVVNVVIQTYIKISTQDAFLEKIFPGTLKSKIFESQII
jgi:hypothetical protein